MAAECSGILLFFLLPVVLTYVVTLTVAFDPYFRNRCVINAGTYTTNSSYERDLNSTFNDMLSTTAFKYGFYIKQFGEVNGIALCRGDAKLDACTDCINGSIPLIKKTCPHYKEAIIWSEQCMLRYSNRSITEISESPPFPCVYNTQSETNPDRYYFYKLNELLKELRTKAASGGELLKYAAANSTLDGSQSLYALEQCTPDLSEADCNDCLSQVINYINSSCCFEKIGCRLYAPSCNLRFEPYLFFGDPPAVPKENTTVEKNPAEKKQNKSSWIPLAASLSAALGLTLFSACGFFIWRRRFSQAIEDTENSQEVQLLELVGGTVHNEYSGERTTKSQEFPSIKLDTLHAATNHFSIENKLGEGGFGPVYKGVLPDGKEIAVKRLSKTSGQGLLEFKNEVILIAKLQHKNLVRLLGCCLEKKEKLLVYEFMPNRSLDVLLFDSNTATQLDWQKRFSIIKGIARGVMYLHEDSRLRIIHRDLKASNVLLDHEMNPKISDFGMARIFSADQNDANTNRVVGTYGYMAPEYAMEGQFSIKSDVFSFGVLLLEIICGKKNNGFHHLGNGESLLTYAWKLWFKGEGMELVDQTLSQSCVVTEVLKCIHIGLLCVQDDPADRPTMTSVVVMLASENITLPRPSEPAYFVRHRAVAEPSPTQQATNNGICSVNEVTFSKLSPR